jgi:hypothetical protein
VQSEEGQPRDDPITPSLSLPSPPMSEEGQRMSGPSPGMSAVSRTRPIDHHKAHRLRRLIAYPLGTVQMARLLYEQAMAKERELEARDRELSEVRPLHSTHIPELHAYPSPQITLSVSTRAEDGSTLLCVPCRKRPVCVHGRRSCAPARCSRSRRLYRQSPPPLTPPVAPPFLLHSHDRPPPHLAPRTTGRRPQRNPRQARRAKSPGRSRHLGPPMQPRVARRRQWRQRAASPAPTGSVPSPPPQAPPLARGRRSGYTPLTPSYVRPNLTNYLSHALFAGPLLRALPLSPWLRPPRVTACPPTWTASSASAPLSAPPHPPQPRPVVVQGTSRRQTRQLGQGQAVPVQSSPPKRPPRKRLWKRPSR